MARARKTAKQLERHFKGVANHRRIAILMLIAEHSGVTVHGIAEELGVNIKTISEHTRRLVHAGLVEKQYRGSSVAHTVSPYGIVFVQLIKTFQYS